MKIPTKFGDINGWAVVWAVVGTVITAWVLRTLWGWFLVPLRVPAIGMAHAFGLRILVRLVVFTDAARNQEHEDAPGIRAFVLGVVLPVLALAAGFVAHEVMGL